MTFYEVLEQVLALLQRHQRLSYRALKLQSHAAEHQLEVVISTHKASMPSGYKLPDLFEVLREGDGPWYRRALEAMIRYLGKNAKRAHPKRDARTGCARLGLKPVFQVSEQQDVKDCEQLEAA